MKKNKAIWITWEYHRRTDSLTEIMGIPVYYLDSNLPRILKHPLLSIKTIRILINVKPKVLFVQNPSVVLTFIAILMKPIVKYLLIVDAHNAGVYPFEKKHIKFKKIFPLLHRKTDRTIVTNKILSKIIIANKGRPLVLPDRLPEFEIDSNRKIDVHKNSEFTVTFICSYSSDEPYTDVIKAGHLLPEKIIINITGDHRKISEKRRIQSNSNIKFTGYLNEDEYIKLLKSSNVIMDLTKFDDCLVCGAYEAVSLGIPLILSDSIVNRDWFFKGVVYTNNNTISIVKAILEAKEKNEQHKKDIVDLKEKINVRWDKLFRNFLSSYMNEK